MSVVTGDAIDGCVVLRLTVTIDAPTHIELVGDFDDVHSVDLTVTFGAVETALNVRGVTERDVVGKVVNFDPLDGIAILPMLCQFLNFFAVGGHLTMAIHAGVDAGNRGML